MARRGDGATRWRVRKRLLVLVAVLVPVNAYWIVLSEVIRYAGHPTTIALFYNVVFWLCLLVGLNRLALRFLPALALDRGELLTLYFGLQLTSALGGHDIGEVLLPILVHPARFADAANDWAVTLLPYLPPWLIVTDPEAVKNFYNGHSTLYTAQHLRAWAVPILCWTGFFGVLCAVMLCLDVILRRQWTESERLPFPLVYLPLELTAERTPLFRERLFWAGVALAAVLQIYNGVAQLYPSLPLLPIKYKNYGDLFTTRPWNAVGWFPIGFYPFAVALGLLLPTDFLLSSWLFYFFWKGQLVATSALALDRTPNFPYVDAQCLGGFIGIALTSLFLARHHLSAVWRHLWEPGKYPAGDDDSPLSYRLAAGGVVVGSVLLFAFLWTAGVPPLLVVAFYLIYFAIAVTVTRLRAELGPPVHDLHKTGPDAILPTVFGPTAFDQRTLAVFGLCGGFNRAYRSLAMPIQLEAMAASARAGTDSRPLLAVLFALGFLGPLCAFWALLHFGYTVGAASGAVGPPNVYQIFGSEPWVRYTSQLRAPRPPGVGEGVAVLVGVAFSVLLNVLRVRVLGFPLHPVGYAVSSSWGMNVLWMPLFLAWLAKTLLLRYGGLPLYRRALPLCYGVILGECVVGSLWTLLGMFTDIPTYGFWP
jgi:hypothetical protein